MWIVPITKDANKRCSCRMYRMTDFAITPGADIVRRYRMQADRVRSFWCLKTWKHTLEQRFVLKDDVMSLLYPVSSLSAP
ncbi:hypothetical protein TNCV_2978861 [Trichonephila clavipes]|nr:hypothetical protein TNCV_2978861 [Trichonephila clavipes]